MISLHSHSSYSNLDAIGMPDQIVQRCIDLNRKAVTITDHDNVFAHPILQSICAKNNIKHILGCEMRLVDNIKDNQRAKGHLTVLAKTYEGYINLMKLLTMAWSDGCFYYKPTIDKRMLFECSNGLIILSGCPSGSLSRRILDDDLAGAMGLVTEFKSVFGTDYYLEVMAHEMGEVDRIAPVIRALSNKFDIKCVLTNDEHFLEKGQDKLQKILWCIRDRERYATHTSDPLPTLYYMTDDEMLEQVKLTLGNYFSNGEISELFNNQERIASDCNTTVPKAEFLKYGVDNPYAELRSKAFEGLNIKGLAENAEYVNRIEKELDLVDRKNFSNYFLVVADIVNWAKDNDILVGPSRGSAASSLLAYCIGITEVDPIRFDLTMERFMSEDRIDPPDIDIDFQDNRRQEVIEYMSKRFKSDNVAQLATVVKFKGKNTLGELGKVFDIPASDIKAVQNTLIYRCLPEGTDVIIDGGTPPKKIENIKKGDKILSYNFKTGEKELDVVKDIWKTTVVGIKHLKFSNGNELICSDNERIYTTNRGFIFASDIKIGDRFIQYRYFGLSNRLRIGRKYEDFLGDEKAKNARELSSVSHKGKKLFNAGKTLKEIHGEYSDIVKYLGGKAAEGNIPWNKGLTKDIESRLKDISDKNMGNIPWSNGLTKDTDYRLRVMSDIMKNHWKDPNFVRSVKNIKKPNNEEIFLRSFLNDNFDGEFEYNGDGRLGISVCGHVPDFVNINGKKKIIEYNGCWYHNCKLCGYGDIDYDKDDVGRLEDYIDFGWDPLVVWRHDLDNPKNLKDIIEKFVYNPNVDIIEVVDISDNWIDGKKVNRWNVTKNNGLYSLWENKGAYCIKKCNDIMFLSLDEVEINNRFNEFVENQEIEMYDIETERNHNFFAYGILLSNSSADARSSATIEDTFKMFSVAQKVAEQYPDILDAKYFEGQIRHTSVHAAGLVVSDRPLYESTAIMRRNGTNVAMLTGESHSMLGLLKMDILGLDYLSILKDLCKETSIDHFSLYSLPLDDEETLQTFNGSTVGIFQFNEASTYSVGRQLGIEIFNDIVLATSLSRPGPLHSNNTQLITEVKKAGTIKKWDLDVMNEITKDTYGYVVFQEQVIRIMHEIGGLEWKDVSAIRSAMSKSLGDEYFNTFREKFIDGSGKLHGITQEYANIIFDHTSTFGCVAWNTRIAQPDGTKKNIEDLYKDFNDGKNVLIPTINISTEIVTFHKPTNIVYSGKKSTYFVRTVMYNGRIRVIRATMDHRFFKEYGGWKSVKDLMIGDKIYVSIKYGSTDYSHYQIDDECDDLNYVYEESQYARNNDYVCEIFIGAEYACDEDTYDITMDPKQPNFIADGFVVHNSWSFNKAHAVGYSLISYWTAYFKAHYPRIFYKVLCNHAKSTEKLREYLREYKEKGYGNILPPKINKSGMLWSVEGNDLRAGLATVLPEGASSVICSIYPITDMNDLQMRAPRRKVNSRIISMIDQYEMFSNNDSLDPFGLYAFAERLSYTPRTVKIADLGYTFDGREVIIAGVLNQQINLKSIEELKATQKLKDWSKRFDESAGNDWCICDVLDDSGGVMHCHVKNYLYPHYKDMLWSKIVGEDVLIFKGFVPARTNYMIVNEIQEWNDRKATDAKCYKCSLIENDFCPPSGNPNAKIVFVGMCPGREEIAQQRPFVGKAGRLLNDILSELHIDRDKDLWVTNSTLCRPVEGDKNIDPDEIQLGCCSERLKAEINKASPKVVVTFGKVAYYAVTGENPKSITEIAGTKINLENYILIPAIHPAAALRPENEKYIPIIKDCIKQAIDEIGDLDSWNNLISASNNDQ